MKTISLFKFVLLVVLMNTCFSSCGDKDEENGTSNIINYEKMIVGTWTGVLHDSDLRATFKRYIFNDSHVVRSYTKNGLRTSRTANGVTTYSNWDVTEENQVGEWRIDDQGYIAFLRIEWNGGSRKRETFDLFQFTGAKLNYGNGYMFLYKGDSNPDF